jgi:hypothetical protein
VVGWENWRTARQFGQKKGRHLGAEAQGVFPKSRGCYVLAKICFTQPLTKTVSKHVTGNYGYSMYNNLKFAFQAAKNIRFSHSNLFWGGSLAPILPSFPLPQHVSDL